MPTLWQVLATRFDTITAWTIHQYIIDLPLEHARKPSRIFGKHFARMYWYGIRIFDEPSCSYCPNQQSDAAFGGYQRDVNPVCHECHESVLFPGFPKRCAWESLCSGSLRDESEEILTQGEEELAPWSCKATICLY